MLFLDEVDHNGGLTEKSLMYLTFFKGLCIMFTPILLMLLILYWYFDSLDTLDSLDAIHLGDYIFGYRRKKSDKF